MRVMRFQSEIACQRNWRETLLVLSLIMISATQLRFSGFPIGAGEIGLVIWIGMTFFIVIHQKTVFRQLTTVYSIFWVVSLISLIMGTLIAYENGVMETPHKLKREFLALLFVVGFTLLLTHCSSVDRMSSLRMIRLSVILSSLFALILLIVSFSGVSISGIEWWMGKRMKGLSENPNQLALIFSPMPFFAMFLCSYSSKFRMMAIMSLAALLTAGLLTRSDALVIGWLSGGGAIIIAIIAQYIKSHLRIPISAVLVMLLLVMVIVLLSAVLMSQDIIMKVYGAGSEQHLQAYRRFDLWAHGVLAGLDSPLFGLGPGNHSGFDAPHAGSEAHNSFIDWFAISGIVGLVAFVSIIALSLKISAKHNLFLFGALVSIVIFSSFHYMLRHPFFWFSLIVAHRTASLVCSRCVRHGKSVSAA